MTEQQEPTGRSSSTVLGVPERAFVGIVGGIVAVTFALIVVTLNRGFDWTDEAFVYTMISSNRVATGEFWGFQHLLNPAYELFGSSILAFRILRLLCYVALSFILVHVARKVLASLGVTLRRSRWVVILLVAQIGTFAAWSYPPRYLGYNEIASWIAQFGGALLILLLATNSSPSVQPRSRRRGWALWSIIGALATLLFIVKVTSAFAFVALALVVAFVPSAPNGRWKRLGFLALGMVVGLAALIVSGFPVAAYTSSILSLLFDPSAQASSGYSVFALLQTYLESVSLTFAAAAVPTILVAIILTAGRGDVSANADGGRSHRALVWERLSLVLGALLVVILLVPRPQSTWDALGISITLMFFFAMVAFAILGPHPFARSHRGPSAMLRVGVGVLVFLASPFVNALGTNNPIVGQTVFSATLWAVGLGVALALLWERSTAVSRTVRFLPVLLAGVIVAGAALGVAADVFVHPYRTQPYLKQTTAISSADLRGIKVSADEAELYEWLHDVGVRENAQSTPATAISAPGALLAFNASGWANPWVDDMWDVAFSTVTASCDRERPDGLYLLQPDSEQSGTPSYDGTVSALEKCGIDFPEDFSVIDRYTGVDDARSITIWQLD